MSSLYNMAIGGFNSFADICLGITKLDVDKIGRFRNAWLSDDGKTIIILTKMGGGNREDYEEQIEYLKNQPNFIKEYDYEDDSVYAIFEYNVEDKFSVHTAKLSDAMVATHQSAKTNLPMEVANSLGKTSPEIDEDHISIKIAHVAYNKIVTILNEEMENV